MIKPNSPILLRSLLVVFFLFAVENCKPKEEQTDDATVSDTTDIASEIKEASEYTEEDEDIPVIVRDFIHYSGTTDNKTKSALAIFTPLESVEALAQSLRQLKDSLMYAGHELTSPEDSAIFESLETKAYEAILTYKKWIASGAQVKGSCPSLLDLTRNTQADDSTSYFLPDTKPSNFFSKSDFFFLGGTPFIYYLNPESGVFSDPDGKPEARYECSVTENGNYLMNSLFHRKMPGINISYGPPLNTNDASPISVRGIGSLIHEFTQRIPCYFILEDGIAEASLISITTKLAPQGLGCVSDQPAYTFACSRNIGDKDILGIYFEFNSRPLTSCAFKRNSNILWTADLNSDGVPDLACLSATFEGIASDALSNVLWFANINGEWKIIDWGMDLDCT